MTLERTRATGAMLLGRLPGRYGFGPIPWIVPLLFALAGAPVSTEGPQEGAWIQTLAAANVAAWLAQGATLLVVRRWALRIPPTPRGGLAAIAVFIAIGAVGGVVQALMLSRTNLPDPPQFIAPATLILFAALTWVCTASIVAIAFSWRDQLADSLRASERHAAQTRSALGRSVARETQRRTVVARFLRSRTIPTLEAIVGELGGATHAAVDRSSADAIERLARDEIRGVSHLLHPVATTVDLPTALAAACRPFGVVPDLLDLPAALPEKAIDRSVLTATELLLEQDGTADRPPLRAAAIDAPEEAAIVISHGRSVRIPIDPASDGASADAVVRQPRWYQVAPAPYGMPWIAIALLNAFSVLVATLAAGTGLWLAALVDMAIITAGTFGIDLLLRVGAVRRMSAGAQWGLIAATVALLGAVAGGVWGALIGGEAPSLAVLGLVCSLSMGLFLPGIRVWTAEIRRLRAGIVLADLAVEAAAIRVRFDALESATAAAEALHATVQSQLLGVAGALGSEVPDDLRSLAIAKLEEVTFVVLPGIASRLETDLPTDETILLDVASLTALWPEVEISLRVPDALPAPALRVVNSVIVEAIGNAVHHGRAAEVAVTATLWPGAVAITVEDDGVGLTPRARDGLGLSAMRSLASEFSLRARPAGGTRLDVRLPFLA